MLVAGLYAAIFVLDKKKPFDKNKEQAQKKFFDAASLGRRYTSSTFFFSSSGRLVGLLTPSCKKCNRALHYQKDQKRSSRRARSNNYCIR
jgi:hypothetical protein